MFESSTGKWLAVAGLLLTFALPAYAGSETTRVSAKTGVEDKPAPTDTATQLVAQLDSVVAFCSRSLPANKSKYEAFVDALLSGATAQELAQIRDSAGYESARARDISRLETSKNPCLGLRTLASQ